MRTKEEILESIRACIRIDVDIDRCYDQGDFDEFEYYDKSVGNLVVLNQNIQEAKEAGITAEEFTNEIDLTYQACNKTEEDTKDE